MGDLLGHFEDEAVPIKVMGKDQPDADRLNRLVSERVEFFPENFREALEKYVDLIGEDDFRDRFVDYGFCSDLAELEGDGAIEVLNQFWKNKESHRICKLKEVTYNPKTDHLGLYFEIEWEQYFFDHGFGLLLHEGQIDYGIDQSYWKFCEDEAEGWFEGDRDDRS
ncbi:hypothetical protein N9891_00360 [bacterium]|nr:hypothetical protein [bacterium]